MDKISMIADLWRLARGDGCIAAAWALEVIDAQAAEIEQLRAENGRLISDIKMITAPTEVGGGADAYLWYEVDRLRREREVLAAAVMAQRERNEHIAGCEQCNYELCPVGGELSYRAKRILDAAISLLSDKGGGGRVMDRGQDENDFIPPELVDTACPACHEPRLWCWCDGDGEKGGGGE